ncbi:hypothetical protein PR048_001964 [Dryococelus australis]|uniref:Transposase n=1 Tax=Dryococelus australis TaxID=614101 RepID=A0ABQ9IKB6_9NEOP|nr:hypothetical protein PR048_001964 [Dryococelus australis]
MGIKRKRTMKTDAVPHLLIPNTFGINDFPERSERLKNRTVKWKLVSELSEMRKRKRYPENSKCEENKNYGTHVVIQELNEQTICQPGPKNEMKLFQMRVSTLEEEIKGKNTCEKKNLNDRNACLRQELVYNNIQHRQLIFKNKKRIWWEDDDITAAVTLRSISRKTYLYLRNNVGLPLPGLSTIRKWTHNLSREAWRLNVNNLFPMTFDKNFTKDKLLEVIKEVEDSGFKVVAILSDMGGGNLISFTIMVDVTQKVWVFADITHLIKLLGNNFLDYGIRLPCGIEKRTPSPTGSCVQDISSRKPYLTSQLLIKYMENNTEEENAI